MTIFEIISLLLSSGAIAISIIALRYAKRAANANEDSAWYAGRANDLVFMKQVHNLIEKSQNEIASAKLQGNYSKVKGLEYASTHLVLNHLKDFANRNEDTKKYFKEYFEGLGEQMPDDKEAIEGLIAYVLNPDSE